MSAFDPINLNNMLPKEYNYLNQLTAPKIILEWLKIYGTKEFPGTANNPVIMDWAKELGVTWYADDSIPWCGLGMGVVAHRAGKELPKNLLRAKAWAEFGDHVEEENAGLGDTLVFSRQGGGHVGTYVGENKLNYHVIGANQGDAVSIVRIMKNRLFAVRRPIYTVQPIEVKKYYVNGSGNLSTNEA